MKSINKVVNIHANSNSSFLDLKRSEKEYPPQLTKDFLKEIEKRGKAAGLLPLTYNLLERYNGRHIRLMSEIQPASVDNNQAKGLSAFQQNKNDLISSLEAGYRYNLPPPMAAVNAAARKKELAIGDHRYAAKSDLGWTEDIIEEVLLNINNTDDKNAYDLISANSNNHPPQVAMNSKELVSHIYKFITRKGNEKFFNILDPKLSTYNRGRAWNFISAFKEPISTSMLKTAIKSLHEKMAIANPEGMFKTLADDTGLLNARDYIGAGVRSDIVTVEIGMLDRYLFDLTAELAGTQNEKYIIIRVNTSDFTMTKDKLNQDRGKALHSKDRKSSARNAIDNFTKLEIPQEYINNVKIIGSYAQHSEEDVTKLVRVDYTGMATLTGKGKKKSIYNVSYVSLAEALKLPSLVVFPQKRFDVI